MLKCLKTPTEIVICVIKDGFHAHTQHTDIKHETPCWCILFYFILCFFLLSLRLWFDETKSSALLALLYCENEYEVSICLQYMKKFSVFGKDIVTSHEQLFINVSHETQHESNFISSVYFLCSSMLDAAVFLSILYVLFLRSFVSFGCVFEAVFLCK